MRANDAGASGLDTSVSLFEIIHIPAMMRTHPGWTQAEGDAGDAVRLSL